MHAIEFQDQLSRARAEIRQRLFVDILSRKGRMMGASLAREKTTVSSAPQQGLSRIRLRAASAALTLVVVIVFGTVAQSAQPQTFTVLVNFTGGSDAGLPYAALIRDAQGNLYGTTSHGALSRAMELFSKWIGKERRPYYTALLGRPMGRIPMEL